MPIVAFVLCDILSPTFFQPSISIFEKMLRPILVYLFLVVLLRVFGKRELAQLNPFDLVVLLSLSNTVQNSIIGEDDSLTGGLIGATALCAVNYLVVRFLFKHRRLDQIIEGRPTVLIENGQVLRDALRRELLNESDLATMAHRQGFASLSEINKCTLEPGGSFSIEGKEPRQVDRYHAELISRLERLEARLEKRLDAEARQ
jgi:uncharacterized membrane protein YcaP (DUF421 family)